MIQFRMLGTVDLRDSEGREFPAVLRRPKLLALLGYLAVARPLGFHRRDTLVALLWPELDNAHARNSLRQAVHALRAALGRDIVTARGEEELAVSEALLRCDVRDFEATFEAGEIAQALALYRGTVLDGLHVPSAPEFERWLDQTRKHLEHRACEAARLLTERADAVGDPVVATRWARRWVELSPLDETPAQRLIELLHAGGDRAAALRAYQDLERRLRRELEVAPSPMTRRLIDAIRTMESGVEEALGLTRVPRVLEPTGFPTSRLDRLRQRVTRRPRRLALMLGIVAGMCLTGGWLVLRATPAPKRLVVLAFTNLGSAEDEYFADGITQEIAARLATINRVRVVGATTASLYKGTTKPVREIAAELGVDYVIEGTVRWQRTGPGLPRIRVTPQLTSAEDGTHLWIQVYDEPLDELFGVQSDIAQKIVAALDIELLESQRQLIQNRPTRNLEAYMDYLRGKEYLRRGASQRNRRAAMRLFEQAVALDSNFAVAYAELARIHTQLYGVHYDRSEQRLAAATSTLNKALELAPDLPETQFALGAYYFNCLREYRQALRHFEAAAASRPSDYEVFIAQGVLHTRSGQFRDAFAAFEHARQLDPASSILAANHGRAYALVRDFGRAEVFYNRALTLSPDWPLPYFLKAELYLRWDGTPRARAVLQEAHRVGAVDDPLVVLGEVWVEMFDRRYDQAMAKLAAAAPEVIEDQFRFILRAQLYAQLYGLVQRHDLEHAYYDSARVFLLARVQERRDDPRLRSALGIAYAGLRRHEEAIVEGEKGVALLPISPHADAGYYRVLDLARIYTMLGRQDAAVDRLAYLLSMPGGVTEAWLRIDPTWDPLRSHPRFQALLNRGK